MNAEEWVLTALASKIVLIDGVEHLNVAVDVVTAVSDFVIIFGSAIEAVEQGGDYYTALSGTHSFTHSGTDYTHTAAEMGYQETFDLWHSESLI